MPTADKNGVMSKQQPRPRLIPQGFSFVPQAGRFVSPFSWASASCESSAPITFFNHTIDEPPHLAGSPNERMTLCKLGIVPGMVLSCSTNPMLN